MRLSSTWLETFDCTIITNSKSASIIIGNGYLDIVVIPTYSNHIRMGSLLQKRLSEHPMGRWLKDHDSHCVSNRPLPRDQYSPPPFCRILTATDRGHRFFFFSRKTYTFHYYCRYTSHSCRVRLHANVSYAFKYVGQSHHGCSIKLNIMMMPD